MPGPRSRISWAYVLNLMHFNAVNYQCVSIVLGHKMVHNKSNIISCDSDY